MKRLSVLLCMVLSLLIGMSSLTVSAKGSLAEVTGYEYASLRTGGKNGTFLYTAYTSGGLVMGTLDETGELTRASYSLGGWQALLEQDRFSVTVTGDAGELCPYAHTHTAQTMCPYFEVERVTLTDTQTGDTLENYYIESDKTVLLPEGSVHFCWGRYGYQAPVTLKWDGVSDYMALQNSDGLWGVYDIAEHDMATAYSYQDMSAVYGSYAKVYNGTAWGRLDVSGKFKTAYRYATSEEFSVKEEVRQLADGTYQVFSKDNEAVSVVFDGDWETVSYEAGSHLLLATAADGTKTFYDINGEAIASFDALKVVRYLQGACYAVEDTTEDGSLYGIALVRADSVTQPNDTVKKGDVNFDGYINSTDVRLALAGVVGARTLTDRQEVAADMDSGATVTSVDARLLIETIIR